MGTYKCVECNEIIEYKPCCVKHHLESKHTKYELIGADVFLEIKS